MSEFLSGLDLAEAYYREVVAAIVGEVAHSAAAVGYGSDILGFDTARSTDHGWGPRLHVFVAEDDVAAVAAEVEASLPGEFRGWPTRFGWDEVPVTHHVRVLTLGRWLEESLGFDPRHGVTPRDWLLTPQQILLEVTAGRVFHDGLRDLTTARQVLTWYPNQVWLWLLACQWRRVAQEEAFVGRAAEAGDDLGSAVVAARLARDLVRLCFLIERRYAPYAKWLGSAFSRLEAAAEVGPPLRRALAAGDYGEREEALAEAYEAVARRFNALDLVDPPEPTVRLFHGRPYRVIFADRFVDACRAALGDAWLRSLPLVGSVDQFADSTDVLSRAEHARRLGAVYEGR